MNIKLKNEFIQVCICPGCIVVDDKNPQKSTQDKIDEFDLIFCKDVLFHLSYNDTLKAIGNIKNSNSKYFISTTFYDFKNKDIATGGWRPINLETSPFLMGSPLLLWKNIEGKETGWTSKSIGVWKI